MASIAVVIPDLGGAKARAVTLLVPSGASVSRGQALVTLETDKATVDLESEHNGTLRWQIQAGQSVQTGDAIAQIESSDPVVAPPVVVATPAPSVPDLGAGRVPQPPRSPSAAPEVLAPTMSPAPGEPTAGLVHAGPGVRFLARQLGVDIAAVPGTGRKGRVLTEDLYAYVKRRMQEPVGVSPRLPALALPDFASFGPIETQPLTQLEWRTGQLTYRAWAAVPQVTHSAQADITELEPWRREHASAGAKLTVLPFIVRAMVTALREHPRVNASLSADGRELILKKYFHVALAVETERGLVVPVLRNCDRLTLTQLASGIQAAAERARSGKLALSDLSGGCITVSSLGHIGGVGFSPIVREPEVAIVGVSRAQIMPVWDAGSQSFQPRTILPFSLSYDHRVIDGALAARFCETMARLLASPASLFA